MTIISDANIPQEPEEKTRGLRRGRRNTPAAAQSGDLRPQVPTSSFNFIADVWDRKKKENKSSAVTGGAVLGVIIVVAVLGQWVSSSNASLNDRRTAALVEVQSNRSHIREITGGIDDLPKHLADRRIEIQQALSMDVDTSTIVDTLFANTPPTIKIQGLDISWDVPELTTTPVSGKPSTTSIAANTSTTEYTPTLTTPFTQVILVIHANSADPAAGPQWRDNLRQVALFAAAIPVVIRAGDGTLTATLRVDAKLVQSRLDQFRAQFGIAAPTPGATTTTKPGASSNG